MISENKFSTLISDVIERELTTNLVKDLPDNIKQEFIDNTKIELAKLLLVTVDKKLLEKSDITNLWN